jgi:hypothetical protein
MRTVVPTATSLAERRGLPGFLTTCFALAFFIDFVIRYPRLHRKRFAPLREHRGGPNLQRKGTSHEG